MWSENWIKRTFELNIVVDAEVAGPLHVCIYNGGAAEFLSLELHD